MLLVILLPPPRYTRSGDLVVAAGFYLLAKTLESLGQPVFALGHLASGHTLKHLAAAGWSILRMLQKRKLVAERNVTDPLPD